MTKPAIERTPENFRKVLQTWQELSCNKEASAKKLGLTIATFKRMFAAAMAWANETGYIIKPDQEVPANVTIQQRFLMDKIANLNRQLKDAQDIGLNAEAIRQGIFELANHSPDEPDWISNRKEFPYRHGIPGLLLSDIHMSERVFADQVFHVNEFDTEICHRRLRNVADRTIHLTHNVLRDPQYPGIVLKLGGDNINGVIHEELDIGSDRRFMEQIIEIADAIHAIIVKFIRIYGRVYVVGVPGNHGRTTRKPFAKFNAATNADWLIYQMLERFLFTAVASGRVVFNCPPARDVTYKVAGRRFRLTHGDQFRGGDGVIGFLGPVTRGMKKKQSMALSLPTSDEHFETLEMGHFHSLHMTHNLIVNGSVKGFDEFALSNNFTFELPQQALYLTHEKYGINHFMPVLADDKPDLERHPEWVSWQKDHELVNPLSKLLDAMDWATK